jgi:hypothetical protein
MKVWIKLIKHYQGGEKSDYMLVDSKDIKTREQQQELMENWGEHSDGGHNYGYRVDMYRLKRKELPPKEWFEKAIKRITCNIGYNEKHIERQRNLLMEYAVILNELESVTKPE